MADKKSPEYKAAREKVISDLLSYFYNKANFPPAEEFDLAHEPAYRLEIFDDLLRDELIKIFSNSCYGFHLRLYIDSQFWERDRTIIDQLWPALQRWRRTRGDELMDVGELRKACPELLPLSLRRALILLNQLSTIAGQSQKDNFHYDKVFVRKEVLKYHNVQDKVDREIRSGHYELVYKSPWGRSRTIADDAGMASLISLPKEIAKDGKYSIAWYASAAAIAGTIIAAAALIHQVGAKPAPSTVINNSVLGNQSLVLNQASTEPKRSVARRTFAISDSIAATLIVSLRKTNCSGVVRYIQSSKVSEELAWRITGIMDGAGCSMGSGGQFTGAPYGITWEVAPAEENSEVSKALEKAFKDAHLENHKIVKPEIGAGYVLISVGMLR
ncbi:MAG: hypothetical protein PHS14_06565 [Elusimicrobia bacterium]|nr:hypothetical protein [Elusimicrobiota bacterium]